ncbi:UbiA family prenyltransferase [Tardisphaera miroshnichenkoae]
MHAEYDGWYPRARGKLGGYLKVIKFHHAPLVEGPALVGALAFSGALPPAFIRQITLIVIAALGVHVFGETYNELVGIKWHMNDPVKRPFVSGTVSKEEGYALVVLGVLIFEIAAWALNPWALHLSPLVVLVTLVYPHLKGKFVGAPYVLGGIVGIDVLGGYVGMWGGLASSLSFLTNKVPWLLAISGIAFTASFDETLNLPKVSAHKSVGIAEFSAVSPESFTLGFIAANKFVSVITAILACCFLGVIPAFFSVAYSAMVLATLPMPRKRQIGRSVNLALVAYAILAVGLAASHV